MTVTVFAGGHGVELVGLGGSTVTVTVSTAAHVLAAAEVVLDVVGEGTFGTAAFAPLPPKFVLIPNAALLTTKSALGMRFKEKKNLQYIGSGTSSSFCSRRLTRRARRDRCSWGFASIVELLANKRGDHADT